MTEAERQLLERARRQAESVSASLRAAADELRQSPSGLSADAVTSGRIAMDDALRAAQAVAAALAAAMPDAEREGDDRSPRAPFET